MGLGPSRTSVVLPAWGGEAATIAEGCKGGGARVGGCHARENRLFLRRRTHDLRQGRESSASFSMCSQELGRHG